MCQVHEAVRKQSVLSEELGCFNWRIDVQSSSRRQKVINEPTAVLEFVVTDKDAAQVRHRLPRSHSVIPRLLHR